MNSISDAPPATPSPFSPPAPKPWYRRRALLVGAGAAVLVAVTVLTDLPTNTNRSSNVSSARSALSEISTDAKPCNLGLTEALGFYRDVTSGHITATHRAQIPGLIHDDYVACSYTNQQIVDLAGINLPSSPTGKQLNTIATNVLVWCDPDALATIGAITALLADPHNAAAGKALVKYEGYLAKDRAAAYGEITALSHTLGASLHAGLTLTQAPHPA